MSQVFTWVGKTGFEARLIWSLLGRGTRRCNINHFKIVLLYLCFMSQESLFGKGSGYEIVE